jgi:hypothetical protein
MPISHSIQVKPIVATLLVIASLTGCSNTDEENKGDLANVPDWIMMPQVEDGIAESACVPWSGNMSIDKDEATHIARSRLAKQIGLRAAGMSKAFADKTTVDAGVSSGTHFENNSRQVFEQTLVGSKPAKAGLFTIDKNKQFCVLVEITPEKTKQLYDGLVSASGKQLNAQDDRILFQQFKAWKGQNELTEALKN